MNEDRDVETVTLVAWLAAVVGVVMLAGVVVSVVMQPALEALARVRAVAP